MFVSGSESLGNSVPVYCSASTSFDVRSWKISLKNFQGLLSIVQLSMFFLLLPFHATAFILYQSVSCLSTTFLNYFLLLFWISQTATLIYYHISSCLSITFLKFFQKLFSNKTEKEGFEPSRRLPDLHPSQGRLFGLLSISPQPDPRSVFNCVFTYF